MSEIVHTFTTEVPRWRPYVIPVDLETATAEQRAAMQVTPSNKGISPYVLTLAHDPESLAVRSPLFNLIMYGKDGLSPGERELGATAASVVNRCVYCAAVHASRFISHTKRTDVIDAIFAEGLDAELDEHLQTIFDFSAHLSTTPPEATQADAQALTDVGLSELEALDLVLSSAIFGWANRLMHTLGEPVKD
ncbi:alkylhydroperoxidase [Rhizobium sp. S9]|uniref:peroxidase-related enzyme n=1 Tax=unclassified Rhizobium TaxID=2613769 RepID=UPI000A2108FC|nr:MULTISPECIES: peroxidase-related enzyme [unclassified Rhizobium]ARO27317.1 peroxidase-related protein [Rhizobium sp. TAL182]PDS99013.1 alkylhydroperoxidase [Rhizobium sp. S9]